MISICEPNQQNLIHAGNYSSSIKQVVEAGGTTLKLSESRLPYARDSPHEEPEIGHV